MTTTNVWGYGPLTDQIREEFGINLELWHTGGNCWALYGVLESGQTMVVTDAEDTLSPMPERVAAERGEHRAGLPKGYQLGWTVSVYPNEDAELYGQHVVSLSEKDNDLPKVLRVALERLAHGTCGDCGEMPLSQCKGHDGFERGRS